MREIERLFWEVFWFLENECQRWSGITAKGISPPTQLRPSSRPLQ